MTAWWRWRGCICSFQLGGQGSWERDVNKGSQAYRYPGWEHPSRGNSSGRRWLSMEENSSGQCGCNGVNKGETRNRPGSRAHGQPDWGGPCLGPGKLSASSPMPFWVPGWQMPRPAISCRRSPPASGFVLYPRRQQSGGGLLLNYLQVTQPMGMDFWKILKIQKAFPHIPGNGILFGFTLCTKWYIFVSDISPSTKATVTLNVWGCFKGNRNLHFKKLGQGAPGWQSG